MHAEFLVESRDTVMKPAVTVMVPTALRRFTGQRASIDVQASTAGDALRAAAREYPQLRPQLFAADDRLRRFINVFVNVTDIRHQRQEDTVLSDGDVITVLPAIAGG